MFLFWDEVWQSFIFQNKMQTDQGAQEVQGETQKETEEKTPPENEEMEVRRSFFHINHLSGCVL